ncbi:4-hydroxy-tetrahydrodipicolinate synthase [Aurantibacter aestuarii]|uniref:4-hydroxy-tetrahydrodipicolinate synthase n=1 Tax=Aurantibacter aestuarii TaxID=1266046 RepID=A0A2T1N9A4_9FLAO|nr:4-hydroxy-tetrahydrodipicolinate synthase [Aurantibacter aestuarii]PSG88438.1 4-hydroxy-tetrahydrodipicolinate synthase [Aurantibacter aestuarii]
MTTPFLGTGIAIVTPFNKDKSVDFKALERVVEFNIKNGVNYIVISGTTGESGTITAAEKKDITACIVKATSGRVPLVLGIGGNNTTNVIEEIKSTDFTGISAILSVAPYYSKPTQEGFYQHFKAISDVSPVDIILYNVPGRTAKNMDAQTTLRLARDFKNVVAVKEAGNNMAQYYELLRDKPEDFAIISGDDDLALGVTLAGGAGVISVIGQAMTKDFCDMIQLGLQGKSKEAYQLHYNLMEIISLIFAENNPSGIKAVLEAMDLCSDEVRLPLVPATSSLKTQINQFLENY